MPKLEKFSKSALREEPWLDSSKNFQVSNYVAFGATAPSMFFDAAWQLPPDPSAPEHKGQARLNWDFNLSSGASFSSPRYAELKYAAKCLIWRLLAPTESDANGATKTVRQRYYSLRRLMDWMDSENVGRFQDLDEDDLFNYLAFLKASLNRRKPDSDERLSPGTISIHLAVIYDLFVYRDTLPDAINFAPFDGKSKHEIADYVPRRDAVENVALPAELATTLFLEASTWVYQYARDILRLARGARRLRRKFNRRQWSVEPESRQFITGFQFSKKTDSDEPWHPCLKSARDLWRIYELFIGACYMLIAGFSGMRWHEIVALRRNCLLPKPQLSEDKTLELFKVRSYTSKTEGSLFGEERTWVIGARPAGGSDDVFARDAIAALSRLVAVLDAESEFLLLTPAQQRRIESRTMTEMLNDFLRYTQPEVEWRIRTHQFRRSFADMVVNFATNAAPAIAQQFGYTNMAWVMKYISPDAELNTLLGHEQAKSVADALMSLLESENLGGIRAEEVMQNRVKWLAQFTHPDEHIALVTELSKRSDLILVRDLHGICYFMKEHAACGGGDNGPNYSIRNAKLCCGCKNLLVPERNRRFHEWRVVKHRAMLRLNPKAAGILTEDWQECIDQSQRILNQLDGKSA